MDPKEIVRNIKIPIQGGLDPKILLLSDEEIYNSAKKYLDAFKGLPYVFNLGHGMLPETNPDKVDKLIKKPKLLKQYQKLNFDNPLHLINTNTKKIDDDRCDETKQLFNNF